MTNDEDPRRGLAARDDAAMPPLARLESPGRRVRRRRRAIVVCAAVLLLGSMAIGGGWLVGVMTSATGPAVPLPPVDATPAQVVEAYVRALDAHDYDTARQLLTPAQAKSIENSSWFDDTPDISDLEVGTPFREPPGASGHSPGTQVMNVPVVLTLDGVDVSMEDGRNEWGYLLSRHSDDERWLIFDEGMG